MKSSDSGFRARYGPWALVAGGSLGIGAAYARQAAARGLNLVNVAEVADPLVGYCHELAAEYGVEVRPLVVDLGRSGLLDALRPATQELEIGLLVYNAGISLVGNFLDQSLEDKLGILDLNCRGALVLAHEYGSQMAARRRGGIVLMSSLSGLVGTALVTTYAATKAFDAVLGEGLWEELRHCGVDVLSVIAGATRTPGYAEANPDRSGLFSPPIMEPDEVVAQAFAALGKVPSVVPGRSNRLIATYLSRLLPRRRAVASMGRSMRAQYRAPAEGRDPKRS
jgi:short-subunit dehydrogenase